MSATPPSLPPPLPAPPVRGITLRAVTMLLPLVGVAAAAALAWLLAARWGASPAAAAALAAALGVLATALPLALLVRRVLAPLAAVPLTGDASAGRAEHPHGFLDRATRELARARRYGSGVALLLVDVDRTERLTDAEVGSQVDLAVGIVLRQTAPTLRSADLLARYSGSQLAVLLSPADLTGALDVAERIRERAEQVEWPGAGSAATARRRISVSIGVALLRPVPADLAILIDDAGDALAAARQAGGNCVRAAPAGSGRQRQPGPRDDRRAQPK